MRTRCSTSPTCCSVRSTCSARWRSSRRAAIGSNRAITTCSSTSSRTPAARSGSWCRCSSSRGAKAPGLDVQRSASTVDLHRRRSQAVDLRLPRRRRVDPRRRAPLHRGASSRRRRAARRSREASGRFRRCWRLSTTCRVTCRRPRAAATRFVTTKRIAFRSTGP